MSLNGEAPEMAVSFGFSSEQPQIGCARKWKSKPVQTGNVPVVFVCGTNRPCEHEPLQTLLIFGRTFALSGSFPQLLRKLCDVCWACQGVLFLLGSSDRANGRLIEGVRSSAGPNLNAWP